MDDWLWELVSLLITSKAPTRTHLNDIVNVMVNRFVYALS